MSLTTSAVLLLLRPLLGVVLMHEARILLEKLNFSSKTENNVQAHYYSYCAILWNFKFDLS